MIVELTPEEAAELEAEEAALAEEEGEGEDAGLREFFQELERIDRQLIAVEADKKDTARDFADRLKALRKQRKTILDDIDDYRLGNRGLFSDEQADK